MIRILRRINWSLVLVWLAVWGSGVAFWVLVLGWLFGLL